MLGRIWALSFLTEFRMESGLGFKEPIHLGHGYIMNHKYRDFPTAALSENDARGKINSHLNVEKSNMALIPKDGETEKLCYEFTGTHNGRHFIIYINAENGCEEEILMLIESENGVLTM